MVRVNLATKFYLFFGSDGPCIYLTCVQRMKYAAISLMFKDAMEGYNSVQESFREKNKERIEKQLRYGK